MENFIGKKVKFSFLGEHLVGECVDKRVINEKERFICKSGRYKFPADLGSVVII